MSNRFISWLTRGWRTRQLAQHIILQVRALNNSSSLAVQQARRQNTLSILEETSAFLAYLQEQKAHASISGLAVPSSPLPDNSQPEAPDDHLQRPQESPTPPDVPDPEILAIPPPSPGAHQPDDHLQSLQESPTPLDAPDPETPAAPSPLAGDHQPEKPESPLPADAPSIAPPALPPDDQPAKLPGISADPVPSMLPSSPSHTPDNDRQGVSATARNLMKLSDWVLQARVGRAPVESAVLDEIYRQLTRAMATEHISLIDESGPCDYERQMVIGTRATTDPALDDHVYSTVRPGYLFRGQLLRPQEVIVFVSEAH